MFEFSGLIWLGRPWGTVHERCLVGLQRRRGRHARFGLDGCVIGWFGLVWFGADDRSIGLVCQTMGMPLALGGISLGRGRGIPRNSSLPTGTQEFLGKGRGQMPEKIL